MLKTSWARPSAAALAVAALAAVGCSSTSSSTSGTSATTAPKGSSPNRQAAGESDCPPVVSGTITVDKAITGPCAVGASEALTVTSTGSIKAVAGGGDATDVDPGSGVVNGVGDKITVTNGGAVDTILGSNRAAIYVQGKGAKVVSTGKLAMGGNNSPGIEIRGDDAVVESSGEIRSGVVGQTQGAQGRLLGNNEGISVVGSNPKVTSSGTFTSDVGNGEWVSLQGSNLTLDASGTFTSSGSNSEAFSLSGAKVDKGDDNLPTAIAVTVAGTYKTDNDESEGMSVSDAVSGTLSIDAATFETRGPNSEGISVSGAVDETQVTYTNISTAAQSSITTTGADSEGISLSPAPVKGGSGFKNMRGYFKLVAAGKIVTSGADSEGISLTGDHIDATLDGSIETTGISAEGISIQGSDVNLTINGSIRTATSPVVTVAKGSKNVTITCGADAKLEALVGPRFEFPEGEKPTLVNCKES